MIIYPSLQPKPIKDCEVGELVLIRAPVPSGLAIVAAPTQTQRVALLFYKNSFRPIECGLGAEESVISLGRDYIINVDAKTGKFHDYDIVERPGALLRYRAGWLLCIEGSDRFSFNTTRYLNIETGEIGARPQGDNFFAVSEWKLVLATHTKAFEVLLEVNLAAAEKAI